MGTASYFTPEVADLSGVLPHAVPEARVVAGGVCVEPLAVEAAGEWDAFVASEPQSTCYHARAWCEVARRAYKIEAPFLVARDAEGGPIRGVLPLFHVPGPMQSHLSNALFGGYGSVLARDEIARRALLDAACAWFDDRGVEYFMLKLGRDDSPLADGFQEVGQWAIATLPLDPDPERLWAGFRKQIRNCVRKAQRYDLEPRRGHDQLAAFYDILAENMHAKGTPIYGYPFLAEILAAFGDRADVITLWHRGRAVSGALMIEHGHTLDVPFASSRPDSLEMNPNNLMYWEIIRKACLDGFEVLDFGQSLKGSGGLAFKLGWGAEQHDLRCWIRAARGQRPKIERDASVEILAKTWSRLPRPVADWLGPIVCRRWLA